jgi:hypothetical protein
MTSCHHILNGNFNIFIVIFFMQNQMEKPEELLQIAEPQVELKAEISEEEKKIAILKAKYGKVFKLTIEDFETEEQLVAYFKKPSINAVSRSMSIASTDPLFANRIIMDDAWIEGDIRMKNDDNILSALASISPLINVKVGDLKKL